MEHCENINNETLEKDPDVTMEQSWFFVDKVELVEDKSEESDNNYTLNDDANTVELISEGSPGSPDETLDSDGISVISEGASVISESEVQRLDNDYCTCSSTNSDLVQDSEYENDSNTSRLSSCTDKSENYYKNESRRNKVFFLSTVTGLSLVATYLFLAENSVTLPAHDTSDHYDERHLKIIISDMKSNKFENCKNDLCKINRAFNKLNNSIPNLLNSIKSNLKSTTNEEMMSHTISKPTKQPDNVCRVNNQENTHHIVNKVGQNIQFKNPKRKYRADSNRKNNKGKSKSNNKNRYSTNKRKLDEMNDNILLQKYKYLKKKEKNLKIIEKRVIKLETKLQKIYKRVKKAIKRIDKQKGMDLKYNDGKSKRTVHHNVTGEWYGKMSKGRSDIRHKEKIGDWMFDRSKMRSRLRDKAMWYFQRSNAREHFRYNG